MRNRGVNTTTKRRKVLVCGYLNVNLGDDLFFRVLADRYPSVDFYLFSDVDYTRIVSRPNLHTIRRNRINHIFASHLPYQYYFYRFDAIVYIGGSIFMERGESGKCTTTRNLRWFNYHFPATPIHIIGSNYGPEHTPEFRREVESVLDFVESVCFRESYSYEIFRHKPNVSKAADVVFGMEQPCGVERDEDSVGFSVIDLTIREELMPYIERYELAMSDLITRHREQDAKVKLFSFCRAEGDVRAMERIVARLSEEVASGVEIVSYEGDVDCFLRQLGSVGLLYATRFHATILGFLLGIPTVPVIYSDKTLNVLNDMGWIAPTIDIRNGCEGYENIEAHTLCEECLSALKEQSINQFASLDKTLS